MSDTKVRVPGYQTGVHEGFQTPPSHIPRQHPLHLEMHWLLVEWFPAIS